jgi:hypothetical protein
MSFVLKATVPMEIAIIAERKTALKLTKYKTAVSHF